MLGRKLLIGGSAAVLSLGLIGIPAASFADDEGGATAQPTVTMTAGSFTVTLPGVGTLSFSVTPGTDTLDNLTVTPADPSITAGTPVLTDEGVQVRFTTPTGIETVEVEVEGDGPVPVVKAEAEGPEGGVEAPNAPGRDDGDNNNQGDNENEQGDGQGTAPGTVTTTTDGHDGSGSSDDGSGDGQDQGTTTTTMPPTTSTTPTTTTSGDGGSDGDGGSNGTSGDGGGDGGGSGSSSDG